MTNSTEDAHTVTSASLGAVREDCPEAGAGALDVAPLEERFAVTGF